MFYFICLSNGVTSLYYCVKGLCVSKRLLFNVILCVTLIVNELNFNKEWGSRHRACVGMFNTCKFSRRNVISYSIYFLLCLIILLLHHFLITTHFLSSNKMMRHRRSLNASLFIFQINFYLWHLSTLIYLSGDIETNPGPITNYAHGFKIFHWNLNSIATDNFVKITLLEAYAIHYS